MTEWDWWADKLAGKPVRGIVDTPRPGFYRKTAKEHYGARKTFTPVAYWPGEDGKLYCREGDEDVTWQRAMELWNSVNEHPVSEEAYRTVAEKGGLWPDEHPLAPMQGHNRPPEPETFEELKEAIEKAAAEARARINTGQPIMAQEEADEIGNLGDRLTQLQKKAEQLQKEELQPFTEGTKEVRARWGPIISLADIYLSLKDLLIRPWLSRRTEEAEQALAEAAATGEKIEVKRPGAGTRGRRISLRSTKRAKIVNYAEALEHFSDTTAVKEVVQDLANKAVRSGLTVPGTEVVEETKAV